MFVSNFRYPLEIRGSSSNFEFQGVQSVLFHSVLQDGVPECDPFTAVSERLGCFNRFEGCVPSYYVPPVVQEFSGFSVLGQDLPIQGPALWPQGFSLGVHKGGGHSCRSSSPVRSSSVLLSGRLASGGGVQGSFGVSSPYDPAVDAGPWVPSELGKVFLTPQRLPFYLGALFDIPRLLARPSEHRVLALQEVIQDLTKGPLAPALFWQKFFGHLVGFGDLVPNCRLLMRPLQLHLLRYFTPLIDSQDLLVPLSPEFKVLCVAWASPSRLLEGKLFAALPPSLVITTDASGQGWGAVLHPHRVSGVWSKEEVFDHINTLELKAVLLALQNLESLVVGHSLLIRSDYMTVVSFIIYQGGTHSLSLCRLALDLWEWCLRRRIFLHAAHIPGEEYIVADFLSRGKYLPTVWVLNRAVFRTIYRMFSSPPELDLFASALNFRLPKYCSRCPDAQAW